MEERMKKYRQLSPERAKVWTEKSPKYQQQRPWQNGGKVPVIYYLCKNRQLDHPHFMEVPLSSPDGLYLRDVIERFNVLRGKGMASSYSWSCKRSYKNKFVWHDLCEDDLILPAHGNEYVLKGSEICEVSNSGYFNYAENARLSNSKVLPEPPSSRSEDTSTSLRNGSLSLTERKINNAICLADASIQVQENASTADAPRDSCSGVVTVDNRSPDLQNSDTHLVQDSKTNEPGEICRTSVPPPPSLTGGPTGGRTDTLLSLIKEDVCKLGGFRKSKDCEIPLTKLKPSNMIMQLVSCGSISVKDHSFGLIHTSKPRFSQSKCQCPLFSSSLSLGKLDCLTRNQRLMDLRLDDEEYFCGSWMESAIPIGVSARPSSLGDAERTKKQHGDSVEGKVGLTSTCSERIRHFTKASVNNLPKMESTESPIFEGPRISSEGVESSRTSTSSGKKHFKGMDSNGRNERENAIKVAET